MTAVSARLRHIGMLPPHPAVRKRGIWHYPNRNTATKKKRGRRPAVPRCFIACPLNKSLCGLFARLWRAISLKRLFLTVFRKYSHESMRIAPCHAAGERILRITAQNPSTRTTCSARMIY